MTVFNRQIATATRLLAKYGQFVTWRQDRGEEIAAPNPTPWLVSGNVSPIVEYKVKIAFLPNPRVGHETFIAAKQGAEIKVGEIIGYMAQVPFVPTNEDRVLRPAFGAPFVLGTGMEYRIVKFEELNVDGAPILYTVTFQV